jgi:pimeloyl-ACP methyl ester carboxylesterase
MVEGSIIVENVSFESEGYMLEGRVYRPVKGGSFPGVVLCHGFPGDEKNMDLAEELAFNGIVVLVFYYRGAWGSEGTYSLRWLAPCARDATDFLESNPYVNSERMGMIGHSMGAVPLASRLKDDPRIKIGVYMAPAADLGALASDERIKTSMAFFLGLAGMKLSGFDESAAMSDLRWIKKKGSPVDIIREVHKPVKFIVGSNDTVTPPESCRMLFDSANEPKEWALIEGADHVFSEHRYPLMEAMLGWFNENL